MLHALQHELGYLDSSLLAAIAEALNISRAEVVGVINFYHDFKQAPVGRHVLRICLAEACQSMGAAALATHVTTMLHTAQGETTRDGAFTLEPVYCLGNCALSPAIMLDGRLYGRVTLDLADRLMSQGAEAP